MGIVISPSPLTRNWAVLTKITAQENLQEDDLSSASVKSLWSINNPYHLLIIGCFYLVFSTSEVL